MVIRLKSGALYDPEQGLNGEIGDLYIQDGRIVAPPPPGTPVVEEYDLSGKVVMAGAIDIHTHIGGGKVTIARTLLPEDHRTDPVPRRGRLRSGCGHAVPSTYTTGCRYIQMGWTMALEPAVLPSNARQAHFEMRDTPFLDTGGYLMLGSDDFFLRLLARGASEEEIANYVGWTVNACCGLGIKVVNPGGINAFKFNRRALDLDEENPHYGVTPRQVLVALARAVDRLGLPHPLHLHGCNLGAAGNVETTLKTIEAAVDAGVRLHLTHVQFHSYGKEGPYGFSSGAARIAEAVNRHPNISIDIGQILFGQTVTTSGDTMRQFANADHAHPKKWVVMDIECDAGCGVVPFRYRDRNFINALQWAIGLELFLLVEDPWRIFLTTDHPNGAPFTSYPHLIRLLMDRSFRNDQLARLHPDAQKMTVLAALEREYTLYEIAILTRAGPARILGLSDRGHLKPGAVADIVVYTPHEDRERMFSKPDYVFKNGRLVVRDGEIVDQVWGDTHRVRPEFDPAIERELADYFDRYMTVSLGNFKISEDELLEDGRGGIVTHPLKLGKGEGG